MRFSHVAVLSMLALSVLVDGIIPFPSPDRGGVDRTRFAAPGEEGPPVRFAVATAGGPQASTQDTLALVDSRWAGVSLPGGEHGDAAGSLPPARANMEVSDVLGPDTAGLGADGGGTYPGASGRPSTVAGLATWYGGPLFQGRLMADGRPYNEWDPHIVASNDFELGSVLEIEYRVVITVVVSDRGGELRPGQVDLSRSGFYELMQSLDAGRVPVTISIHGQSP